MITPSAGNTLEYRHNAKRLYTVDTAKKNAQ